MVFGECGQGKSTTLNELVQIAVEKYVPGQEHGCHFKSNASFKSVTSCVSIGSLANMTFIDTPGLNDPDAARTDKKIGFSRLYRNLIDKVPIVYIGTEYAS